MRSQVSVRRRYARHVVIALCTAFLGCATFGRGGFKDPVVNLRDVVITGLGVTGGSVDVVLSVYNPNRFRLDAAKLTYRVDIDSIPLGSGALDNQFVVQSGDSSLVHLPIRFSYVGLGLAGRSLITAGSINYRVRGDFTVGTPIGSFTRPYDRSGRYSSVTGVGR